MCIEQGDKKQTKCIEILFNNIIAENLPRIGKGGDIQVQEAFKTLNRQYQKRNTPRNITIKILDIQRKIYCKL
jgi:hypothetical protein